MSQSFTKRGMDMPEADICLASDRYLEALKDQSVTQELQDILSFRLPSFYRCAFRLLGMRLMRRMLFRKPSWPLTNI
jgi:hypothetical protein